MITSRGILVGAALLLALGGCAAQPAESPEPTEAAPTSDAPQPAGDPSVVVTADGFQVLDASGAVQAEISLGDDYLPAVDALTDAIGSDPVTTQDDACGGTSYDWDGKVQVFFNDNTLKPPFPRTELTVRTAAIGDLAFVTDTGFSVGDPSADIIAGLPADQVSMTNSFVWSKLLDLDDGTAFGGTAWFDEDGNVNALVPKSTGLNVEC